VDAAAEAAEEVEMTITPEAETMAGDGALLVRRAVLFGVPLCYIVLAALHPMSNPQVGDPTTLWIGLHLAQLVLIGGMGYVFWLLVQGVDGRAAALVRGLILPFVVVYTAMDSVLGIAWGIVAREANELPVDGQAGAQLLVDRLLEPSPAGYVLYFGAGLLFLALSLGTVAALAKVAPVSALAFIAAGALIFVAGHAAPLGPIGMLAFLVGVVWTERARTPPAPVPRVTHDVPG
jgi:hypothetical protein